MAERKKFFLSLSHSLLPLPLFAGISRIMSRCCRRRERLRTRTVTIVGDYESCAGTMIEEVGRWRDCEKKFIHLIFFLAFLCAIIVKSK